MAISEYKIIHIDEKEKEGYVSLGALVNFSGNKAKSIKELIRKYEATVMKFSSVVANGPLKQDLKLPRNVGNEIDWNKVILNEQQAAFIITLMTNTPEVLLFKETLIQEFCNYKLHLKQMTKELEVLKEKQQSIIENKSHTIDQLADTDKSYKKILQGDRIYISANGLVKGEPFTAKAFKEFMLELNVVKKVPKLQYYWKAAPHGLDSGLVIGGEDNTPYYALECKELYKQHLSEINKDEVAEEED